MASDHSPATVCVVVAVTVCVSDTVCVTWEIEVAVTDANAVGVVVLYGPLVGVLHEIVLVGYSYTVTVAVVLIVDDAVMLLITGKVVVLVTVRVVSTHLTQTVLTKAFALPRRLLKADCLASAEVVEGLAVVFATARLAFWYTVWVTVAEMVSVCVSVTVSTVWVTVSVATVVGSVTAAAVTLLCNMSASHLTMARHRFSHVTVVVPTVVVP